MTYYTHWEEKNEAYKNGRIKQYVGEKCHKRDCIQIDEVSLVRSHRNNQMICDFSSTIYPSLPATLPCLCPECHPTDVEHQGVFLVKRSDVKRYVELYRPIQLRYNILTQTDSGSYSCNYGQSKGKTYNRVLIYPTNDIKEWLIDKNSELKDKTRAALYVALTRAKYSAAFVVPDDVFTKISGLNLWE